MAKDDLDAIELLTEQHRQVEALFDEIEEADEPGDRTALFDELADSLAIHATIEERHFYPAVRERKTPEMVLEAFEEHKGIKRALVDLLDLDPEDRTFQAKVKVLQEQVDHHVQEEEKQLFPAARKVLSSDELVDLAQEMAATADELEGQDPRYSVREQLAGAPEARG